MSVFVDAIKSGDANAVQAVIASVDVNALVGSKITLPPIVLAAWFGHAAVVDVLLRAGACIDIVNRGGQTACHTAVMKRRVDVVALLLAHGTNLGLRDVFGRTPLDGAIEVCDEPLVSMLLAAGAPLPKPLSLCAVATMSTTAIQALANRGVAFGELCNRDQRTPLHLVAATAEHDDAAMMRALVANGVALNAQDCSGDTSVHIASAHGRVAHLRWLVEEGADVDTLNAQSRSALHEACVAGHTNCVEMLLAAGACASTWCNNGETACHLAVRRVDAATTAMPFVHAFAAVGTDLNAPSRDGISVHEIMTQRGMVAVDDASVENARRRIARLRLDFVRSRALQICIGLQSMGLDALQMCEILMHACGPVAPVVAFHHWWAIATTVKHFKFK